MEVQAGAVGNAAAYAVPGSLDRDPGTFSMVDLSIVPPVGAGMVRLCETREVPEEGGLRIPLSGRDAIAVFRSGDRYYVTDDQCTHGGASLSEGLIEDDEVECPFHLGR